ncbi:MAG: lysophospholipid acyltransferase family protein [Beijerinckiaceae bacterium]
MSAGFTRASRSAGIPSIMVLLRLIPVVSLICAAILVGCMLQLLPPGVRRLRETFNRHFCRLACRVLGVRVVPIGQPPANRPALLVSNHVSWTDVVALGSLAPICFLARHDVADWPGLGLLARLFGTLFVERGKIRKIPAVNHAMAERMLSGHLVSFFPEATTGDGTRMKRFHAVHLAAGRDLLRLRPDIGSISVAPAAIVYSHRQGLPLGRVERAGVAWYGDSEFAPHLIELLSSGGVECRISFLPAVEFESGSDRKAVARRAEAAIRCEIARILSGENRSRAATV